MCAILSSSMSFEPPKSVLGISSPFGELQNPSQCWENAKKTRLDFPGDSKASPVNFSTVTTAILQRRCQRPEPPTTGWHVRAKQRVKNRISWGYGSNFWWGIRAWLFWAQLGRFWWFKFQQKTWLNDVKCLYSLYVAKMMLNFQATRQKKGPVGELDTPSKKWKIDEPLDIGYKYCTIFIHIYNYIVLNNWLNNHIVI